MLDALNAYFDSSGFMPHGHCFLWTPSLLWGYVIADTVIAASYYTIPVALWYFVKKRRDLPFSWIFVMFGVFVMACGTTHILSIWNIWYPNYWLDAGMKVVTAIASLMTAVAIWPLIPRALSIPSQAQLQAANRALQDEVTQRRRAEQELQQINATLQTRSAELESVNRELEAFSYSVSHDLRAPLRHIDAFVSLLREEARDMDPIEARYLERISSSSSHMGNLIDDLLNFSRTIRLDLNTQAVDLNGIVAGIRATHIPENGGGTIDWHVAPLPVVCGDAGLLRVVFTNLIGNAIKFSAKREQPRIEIDARTEGLDMAVIRIKDNGVGFDPRYKDKLFGVFQRLHSDEEFEGTGIGLATVRRIVEKHGGTVTADGGLGSGATFTLTLQRAH